MTNEEIMARYDELCDKYFERFGKNYPYMFTGSMTLKQACEEMEQCLKDGKPKPEPELDKDKVY